VGVHTITGEGISPVAVPPLDAFVGPDEGLGSLRGWEFDLRGGVVVDEALADRGVEGGAQGGPDAVHGGGGDGPHSFHQRPLVLLRAGSVGVDAFVAFDDGLEHRGDVPDAQLVEPDLAQVWQQVQVEVAGVGAGGGVVEGFAAGQPLG
jgi:hypothetical protein